MRVVISGPTGAIGHALVRECVDNGMQVLAICRRGSNGIANLPKSECVRILELNLEEYASFDANAWKREKPYDVFFHFAWEGTTGEDRNDMDMQNRNVGFSLDAVRLANKLGCKRFIGAGSQAEYGRVEGRLNAHTPTFPENGYGMAKLCAGQMTKVACRQLGMQHIWTRILSVYGPYDTESSMVASTIRSILNGEDPLFTKGEQQWDYLYSSDAARAMLLLADKGKDGRVYVIGSGKTKALSEYIHILCEKMDSNIVPRLGAIPYQRGQVMYLCADVEELKSDTGFEPKVSFEEGIEKTIAWAQGLRDLKKFC